MLRCAGLMVGPALVLGVGFRGSPQRCAGLMVGPALVLGVGFRGPCCAAQG